MKQMLKLAQVRIFIYVVLILVLIGWGIIEFEKRRIPPAGVGGEVVSLSLSTNGQYVLSIDKSHHVVLWNIVNKSYKVIDSNGNPYSAFFIPNQNVFLYQRMDKEVVVENTAQQVLKEFNPKFLSYGNAISSDQKAYIGENYKGEIFEYVDGQEFQYADSFCFNSDSQYICKQNNLIYPATVMFSSNNKYFLTSDIKSVSAWVRGNSNPQDEDGTPSFNINSYISATYAPNVEDIVIGEARGVGKIMNMKRGDQLYTDLYIDNDNKLLLSNYENIVLSTNANYAGQYIADVLSIKFIDNSDYLVFYNTDYQFDYAALYSLNPNKRIKYLKLADYTDAIQPYSAINKENANPFSYYRRLAIDTAPSAHILAMGQNNGNGIMVYQYDPATQSLKLIWSPQISNFYKPENDISLFESIGKDNFLGLNPNNPKDLSTIGDYFYYGDLVGTDQYPVDYQQAIYWYLKSANLVSAYAQDQIGQMYSSGKGVAQSDGIAYKWFLLAAKGGNPYGQYNVGIDYLDGVGTMQDFTQALYWLNQAANQKFPPVYAVLGVIYITGQGVKSDLVKANQYFSEGAKLKDPNAMRNYGFNLFTGTGINKNMVEGYACMSLSGLMTSEEKVKYYKMLTIQQQGNVKVLIKNTECLSGSKVGE